MSLGFGTGAHMSLCVYVKNLWLIHECCEAKPSISILLGTPDMIYEIQAIAKASLLVPGRYPSNTLFSLLFPCFTPASLRIHKNRIIKSAFLEFRIS